MSGILTAQFVTTASIPSDFIRWVSIGPVSHVDIVMPNGGLLGAHLSGGVKVRPPNYEQFTFIKRLEVELPDIDAAMTFARAQAGKPYNWMALVDMALHRKRRFAMNQSSWFCDELIYATCMAGGVDLLDTKNPLNLTPYEVMLSPYWRIA